MTIQEVLQHQRPFKRPIHQRYMTFDPHGYIIWHKLPSILPSPMESVILTRDSLLASDWDYLPLPPPSDVISMADFLKNKDRTK